MCLPMSCRLRMRFELFTGVEAPDELMRDVIERTEERRGQGEM